jgi:GNAT superfamily N-acetyltransferase
MSAVQPVAYAPSRREELVELMEEVWGDPEAGEHVEWLFERSPVEPGLIELAELDGTLAGTVGFTFARLSVRNRTTLAAFVVRIASRPRFRGRGVFTQLLREGEEHCRARGAELGVTMANDASRPLLLARGWRPLAARRVWLRPMRLRPGPAGAQPPRRRYAGVSVAPLDSFGRMEEEVVHRAAPLLGDHVALDADYLNWRYGEAPHAYRCFTAGTDGFGVVRRMRQRGLDTGVVCTLIAVSGRATRALLARAADELRGAQVLVALPPPPFRAAWLSAGFLPTSRTMAPLGKALVDDGLLPEAPAFQLGDYDFV